MPAMLAPPSRGQVDALRATLRWAVEGYPLYRALFEQHGISPAMAHADPIDALARLPVFDTSMAGRLAAEALALRAGDLGGVEPTSGSTGGLPKRRVLSEADLRLDAALLTRLMRLAGVHAGDRVVSVEFTVTTLSMAFLEGCERLGVRGTAAVAVMARADVSALARLAPTVLIGPPAVIARIAPALTADDRIPAPRLVIYNGDRLAAHAAAAFRARGAGLRSLYGLTETSALGVECSEERGVHLAGEHALSELRHIEPGTTVGARVGELIVTTLGFSMPLVRYPTGDRVQLVAGRCACGSPWPRVDILGRLGGRFALFDLEFTAYEFRALLLDHPDERLQIVIETVAGANERITFRLTGAARSPARVREMRRRLRGHPLLDYLLHSGLIRVRLSFDAPAAGRKLPEIVDRRTHGGMISSRGSR